MGFNTAKAIIKAGKNCACIAFYEEDPFELDQLAKENNVTMIMDCGVYPGMGSALIMHKCMQLDKIENGHEIIRPALSDPEYIFFPKIGTLEAFNTDSLRTLATTIDSPNLKEKTLRYPGHIEKMVVLRELGFFSKEETITIKGEKTSPLEMTAQVLFPNWKLKQGETDITIFQSIIEGTKDGQKMKFTIDLYDKYCPETDVTSMARTTGYTATIALRMIAEGIYSHKGISPPEYIGKYPECIEYMQKRLKERGVNWEISDELV